MSTLQTFLKELASESVITHKMLERIPDEHYDWRPHEKSMTIRELASHIAELPDWISMAFTTTELDFQENPYQPIKWNNVKDLLDIFEKSLVTAQENLRNGKEEDLLPDWILRNGSQILLKQAKGELVRISLSQTIHHRAQLGVYLRLLNVPIPGTYGPSADEPNF